MRLPLVAVIAMAACDDGGVHVIVTAETASFAASRPFDWIEVTAKRDGQSTRACLFPRREVPSPLAAAGSCADEQRTPRDSDFAFDQWELAANPPRAVNFSGSADALELSAIAGFGSRPGPSAAPVTTASDRDYPEVTLSLAGGTDFLETTTC